MAVDRAHGNQASRKLKFNPGTVFFLYLAGNDVTLLHCVSFTPFSVVAVRLNDIHIFWIAIGSGSRLRRNMLECFIEDTQNLFSLRLSH